MVVLCAVPIRGGLRDRPAVFRGTGAERPPTDRAFSAILRRWPCQRVFPRRVLRIQCRRRCRPYCRRAGSFTCDRHRRRCNCKAAGRRLGPAATHVKLSRRLCRNVPRRPDYEHLHPRQDCPLAHASRFEIRLPQARGRPRDGQRTSLACFPLTSISLPDRIRYRNPLTARPRRDSNRPSRRHGYSLSGSPTRTVRPTPARKWYCTGAIGWRLRDVAKYSPRRRTRSVRMKSTTPTFSTSLFVTVDHVLTRARFGPPNPGASGGDAGNRGAHSWCLRKGSFPWGAGTPYRH